MEKIKKIIKKIKLLSSTTIKKSLYRAAKAAAIGALAAFVAVPVDLSDPKKYVIVLSVAMITGALMGLQKLSSGYIKYDLKN